MTSLEESNIKMEIITLAGGCFWCTEAVFSQLKGVLKVTPGYSGGTIENPSYWDVASGRSGHIESVQIEFDPNELKIKDLLYVFFKLHDPTQKDGQGADIGLEYRSMIFYNTKEQKEAAQNALNEAQKSYSKPIVTEIREYKNFYPAEQWHKDYYFKNKGNMYCTLVIDPKIQKLKKEFAKLIKN
jgi:peptide-methionine (S)-S-oxide reductase